VHFHQRKGKQKETSMNDERDKFQPVDNFQPVIEAHRDGWASRGCLGSTVPGCIGMRGMRTAMRMTPQALATQSTQSKTFQQNQEQLTQRLAQAEQTNAQSAG